MTSLVPTSNCQFQVLWVLNFRCSFGISCCGYRQCGTEPGHPSVFFLNSWPTESESKKTVLCHAILGRGFSAGVVSAGSPMTRGRQRSAESVPREVGCRKLRTKIKENQRDFERSILSVCATVSHVARLQHNSFHCDLNPSEVVTGHSCSSLFPAQWRQKITKILSWLPGWPGLHSKTLWAGKGGRAEGGEGEVSERNGEEGSESVMHVCSLAEHYFKGLWFQFYVWVLGQVLKNSVIGCKTFEFCVKSTSNFFNSNWKYVSIVRVCLCL